MKSLFNYYLMKNTNNPSPQQKVQGTLSRLEWLAEQVIKQEQEQKTRVNRTLWTRSTRV